MKTITSKQAEAMVAQSMDEGGSVVEMDGVTYVPGSGYYEGTHADAQSGSARVRIAAMMSIDQAHAFVDIANENGMEMELRANDMPDEPSPETHGSVSAPDATVGVSFEEPTRPLIVREVMTREAAAAQFEPPKPARKPSGK